MSQIIEIKSKVSENAGRVLHKVIKLNADDALGRADVSDTADPLQVAFLQAPAEKEFPAHKHILKDQPSKVITQEAWVIMQGAVEISYFDTDDSFLAKHIINPGDCSVTFGGGHSYRVLSAGVQAYEFKSGPYNGQKKDKAFI